jgi:hypothetical protein
MLRRDTENAKCGLDSMAQVRIQWHPVLNTVMNLRFRVHDQLSNQTLLKNDFAPQSLNYDEDYKYLGS